MHIIGIKNYKLNIKEFKQIFKYAFVGIICQTFDYFITIFFIFGGANLFISNLLGYISGSSISYVGHTKFTFKYYSKEITSKKQILFFLIACMFGSLCGYFLIMFLMLLNLDLKNAKLLQLILIAIIQYFFNSKLTFKSR